MFSISHTAPTLRFKRWSRKSYAAFFSVGRHVTIGNLKTVVADTFLRKQKNTISLDEGLLYETKETEYENSSPPPDDLQLIFSGLLPILFKRKPATTGKDIISFFVLFTIKLLAYLLSAFLF